MSIALQLVSGSFCGSTGGGAVGSGAVNSLIEEGVIAAALCRINTPLDTLVYLLPLLPLKGEEVSL